MKNAAKKELMDQLAQYGYDLSVPGALPSLPEKVLQALLKEDDMRLVEGFPVVLANALSEKKQLEWEKKSWSPEVFSVKGRKRWTGLMAVSVSLFRLFGVEKEAQDRALKLLNMDPGGEKVLAIVTDQLTREEVEVEDLRFSTDRLKTSFRNYVVHQAGSGKELEEQKSALEFELLLSALFTTRQKELLQKRLAGKPMTKTEREYYSRVVKKRLNALADPRLHQMASNLV